MQLMRHAKQTSTEAVDIAEVRKQAPWWRFMVFLPVAFLWMELVFRAVTVEQFFGIGLLFVFGFTVSAAAIVYVLCTLFSPKVNRRITIVFLAIAAAVLTSEMIYEGVFPGTFYDLDKLSMAGEAMGDFGMNAVEKALERLVYILLLWLPVVLYIIFGKKWCPAQRAKGLFKIFAGVAAVVLHAVMVIIILCSSGDMGPRYYYISRFDSAASVEQFGLLGMFRLDIRYDIIPEAIEEDFSGESSSLGDFDFIEDGGNDTPDDPPAGDGEETPNEGDGEEKPPEPIVYTPNVIESLDFEALAKGTSDTNLKKLHEYFASVDPTMKNEYTGKLKGKNLIFIVAEGFSPYAVREDLTPTLYKLSHEGIQCTNYYTPGWGVSTSDGEYTSLLGLMPATGVRSMEYSADRNMYFALGNQLKAQGYNTYAYHNHTYTYYGRDKSHPNLGYTYKGIGNGLTLDYSDYYPGKNTKTRWPNSDYLMAKATADEYMTTDAPFHTYYLTVSGHMNYTFMGNSMSSYHKAKVKDLPYSEEVKAYLACQIELDLMLEELIAKLEEKGLAEDTLLVVTADHYPYGLQQGTDFYSEMAGKDTTSTFEKYRNTLIMWHKGMESMVIDEPVYSIDLLPTLSNLFGVEYDSRLLMGRDFLSDAPPLVCFSDQSWITEYGRYNAKTRTFTLVEGQEWSEENKKEYVKAVNTVVRRKFTFSNLILKEDYYDVILGK